MKKLLVLTVAFFAIAGCSTFSGVMSVLPEKSKEATDAICAEAVSGTSGSSLDFYAGGYEGWYLQGWKSKLTVQQEADYKGFMAFCAKPVGDRTMKEYGYWEATKVRTLDSIVPFKSVIAAAKKLSK